MSETPLVKRSVTVIVLGPTETEVATQLRMYNIFETSPAVYPGVKSLLPGDVVPTGYPFDTPWTVIDGFRDERLFNDMKFQFGPPIPMSAALRMENVEVAINPRKRYGDIP